MERQIIEARLNGDSFCNKNKDELLLATDQIILTCSAIYGCELPYTEVFANTLSDQIISFINKFLYGNLTLAEIILAMQINLPQTFMLAPGIEIDEVTFTGRTVNVAFLAGVLKNYKRIRNLLDRKIQNHIDGY